MSELEQASQRLVDPVDRRLRAPARALGMDLPVMGVVPRPDGRPLVVQNPGGDYILAARWEFDPASHEHGGHGPVIPELVYEQLHALEARGASWDETYVVHELAAGWTPEQPLPQLVPEPRTPMMQLSGSALEGARVLFGQVGRASLAVGKTLGSAAAAGAVGLARLDPVLLAGIVDAETDMVALVELARWEW
jgi:hypothetical protein